MALPITTLTACILSALFVLLSVRVIQMRGKSKVSLGDGGDEILVRRIRGQGNLAEYAPFGILLILLAELQVAPAFLTGVCAAILVMGRLCHAYALSFSKSSPRARITGMIMTFTGIVLLICLNLFYLVQ